MILDLPHGARWEIREAPRKLAYRAQLPGARLFDLSAHALREAKAGGVGEYERFSLA